MAALNPLHRGVLLLTLASFLAAHACAKPRDDDHHAGIWDPTFPLSQYKTHERPSHASTSASAHSKIALHYEPNIFTLGLSGGYYGEISLGTPPQTLTVLFGTEICDAWVADFPCGSKHKFYNHSKSSSYVANGTTFGDPDSFASGFYSEDTLQIGSFAIHHQLFAEVNNVDNFPKYPRTALGGVIGFGRDTAAFDPSSSSRRRSISSWTAGCWTDQCSPSIWNEASAESSRSVPSMRPTTRARSRTYRWPTLMIASPLRQCTR